MIRENEVRSGMKSNMAMFTNPTKPGKLWSRTDAIRAKRNNEVRAEIVQAYRVRTAPVVDNTRFAVVRKFKNRYHVVGLGFVNAENHAQLKVTLKTVGYTHFRMGGLKFSL